MDDYISPDKLGLFLYLCAPGLILTYMRSQFLTGRMPPPAEGILTFVTLSVIYQAAILPFSGLSVDALNKAQLPTYKWALLIFVLPAVIGALLGLNARHQWLRKFLRQIRINTVHPVATAWDWRFGQCQECYVLVTMKNEVKWAGFLGAKSFLSSAPGERDIYIEQVYEIANDKKWVPRKSGVWLAGAEVQSIEQWPKSRR